MVVRNKSSKKVVLLKNQQLLRAQLGAEVRRRHAAMATRLRDAIAALGDE
mgnify:CR=1 FL=1